MVTIVIIGMGCIIIGALIMGMIDDTYDLELLYAFAIALVVVLSIASIIAVNQEYTEKKSSTKVTPTIEVNTIVKDGKVVSSDTTYTYKFKK